MSAPSSPEEKKVFNDYSDNTSISGTGVNNSNVEVIDDPTNSEKGKIISYYYPGKKNATDPQSKTDERLVRIKAKIVMVLMHQFQMGTNIYSLMYITQTQMHREQIHLLH